MYINALHCVVLQKFGELLMAMEKSLNLRVSQEEYDAIEAEQKRLAEMGVKVSLSQAARTLMVRGSTVTHMPNANPTTLEIGDTFKEAKK
jgi:hypothetical protein